MNRVTNWNDKTVSLRQTWNKENKLRRIQLYVLILSTILLTRTSSCGKSQEACRPQRNLSGVGGGGYPCPGVPPLPVRTVVPLLWTDRHLCKHYLPASLRNAVGNNSALENNYSLILTHKFHFDEVRNSNILQENSVFSCRSELEPDVPGSGGIEGWEFNGGVRLAERHHVIKHICNGNASVRTINASMFEQQIFCNFVLISCITNWHS